ncbi:Phasin [Maritimibacter sp. 55A14]|uniref:phasin family protein n=1 Tax=Maritimibacter sp. 55A14 TaxID=2174844 RepID=UPI000D60A094|nr:phasin family protein [Maritimibacter sp. 55A14]PWE32007.1 Phasin [Maritimibacter sp. 55A14]
MSKQQQDYTKAFSDLMESFPTDFSALQDAFRNSAELGEKMTSVALAAAEQSAELSNKWTKETLSRVGEATTAKTDPADYTRAASDLASSSVESASENLAAFAEIAKRVQMETIELMLAAGRDAAQSATPGTKKAK